MLAGDRLLPADGCLFQYQSQFLGEAPSLPVLPSPARDFREVHLHENRGCLLGQRRWAQPESPGAVSQAWAAHPRRRDR